LKKNTISIKGDFKMITFNELRTNLSGQGFFRYTRASAIQIGTKRISLYDIGVWFYLPYRWLVFVPSFIVVTFITMIAIMFFRKVANAEFAGKHVASRWARITAKLIPMSVSVSGKQFIEQGQSYVIVANHQSFSDIFLVYGWIGVDFKWVMKKSIKQFPLIGNCCRNLDHIFIDRSDSESAIRTINQARNKIISGTSVFFFPEGTRSENSRMLSFKKGSFRLALDLGLPILPVTLNGTEKILPKNTMRLIPGPVEMIIHSPIDTSSCDHEDMDKLIEKTRSIIAGAQRDLW